jgi:integration host factor subunit alpha
MTKADLIDAIYERMGEFSKKESAEIVEICFHTIKESLSRGDKVKISGFGNFVVKSKNKRKGRNLRTGEEIPIAARKVLKFQSSFVLKKRLNT